MKKHLLSVLCVGALVALPGCGWFGGEKKEKTTETTTVSKEVDALNVEVNQLPTDVQQVETAPATETDKH